MRSSLACREGVFGLPGRSSFCSVSFRDLKYRACVQRVTGRVLKRTGGILVRVESCLFSLSRQQRLFSAGENHESVTIKFTGSAFECSGRHLDFRSNSVSVFAQHAVKGISEDEYDELGSNIQMCFSGSAVWSFLTDVLTPSSGSERFSAS